MTNYNTRQDETHLEVGNTYYQENEKFVIHEDQVLSFVSSHDDVLTRSRSDRLRCC